MACNIVFIGGGSVLWTGRFATDLFLKQSLRGSRMTLVDTDETALALMVDYCRLLNDALDAGWQIESAPLDAALNGADYVVVSISTGGLDAFELDYRIPEQYGVYHAVGDTVGPAGISRTLRNVPVFIDIAERMQRICPDAWMIHVTNPLAQLTRCVAKSTQVKVVGLCHNFEGSMQFLARYLGAERKDMHAETFGVNHFSWLRDPTCHGKPIDDRLSVEQYLHFEAVRTGQVQTGTTDDEINRMTESETLDDERFAFELYELFGLFPVGGPPHITENFSYFLNDPAVIRQHRIRRKGVLPRRREGRQQKIERIHASLEAGKPLDPLVASREDLAHIVESLHTGEPCRAVVNLPNTGQIPNLPANSVVETWGEISRDKIEPLPAGEVPTALKGFIESIITEEELAVEAALTGDRQLVYQAMWASPMMQNKDMARPLADELLAAQKQHLPQFDYVLMHT